jgi:mannitol/fructose-specific phosphotransferase system IIA component (Ntr-type)
MGSLDRLDPALIRIAPPWRTFADTVRGLVAALVETGTLPAAFASRAVDAIVARESEASTALLEIHAGVPHARLSGLPQAMVALAVSPDGLYEAVPTVAIQIVALVLSPLGPAASHLDTLADVATVLRSEELRARLLAAHDGADGLAVLRAHARARPGVL